MKKLRLRKAQTTDCVRLWRWRNESEARHSFFSNRKIPYEEHKVWFTKQLTDPKACLLIGENKHKEPVGRICINQFGHRSAEIHILINRKYRNRGFGKLLIRKAVSYVLSRLRLKKIIAHVRLDNPRSIGAFKSAGFTPKSQVTIKKHLALKMEFS